MTHDEPFYFKITTLINGLFVNVLFYNKKRKVKSGYFPIQMLDKNVEKYENELNIELTTCEKIFIEKVCNKYYNNVSFVINKGMSIPFRHKNKIHYTYFDELFVTLEFLYCYEIISIDFFFNGGFQVFYKNKVSCLYEYSIKNLKNAFVQIDIIK